MMKINSIRFKITAIAVAAVLVAMIAVFAVSYPPIQAETDRSSVEMMRRAETPEDYFATLVW